MYIKTSNKKNNSTNMMDNSLYDSLKNMSVLPSDKQRELLMLAQAGDIDARNTLIETNVPFIIKTAKQFLCSEIAFEELLSEGYLGLHKAIDKFDICKKNNFISYAVFWIKYYISKFIYNSAIIRKPINKIRDMKTVYKIKKEMQNNRNFDSFSSEQTEKYISRMLNMSEKSLKRLMLSTQKAISLDDYISNETSPDSLQNTIEDLIADNNVVNPETYLINEEIISYLRKSLGFLPKRDADIIKNRYGMVDGKVYSLQGLSKKYNLSKERVRQIEKKSLQKIKNIFSNLGLILSM